jgi:hypothetical protein
MKKQYERPCTRLDHVKSAAIGVNKAMGPWTVTQYKRLVPWRVHADQPRATGPKCILKAELDRETVGVAHVTTDIFEGAEGRREKDV